MRTRRCVTTTMIALTALDSGFAWRRRPRRQPRLGSAADAEIRLHRHASSRRSFFSGGRDDVASPGKQRQT